MSPTRLVVSSTTIRCCALALTFFCLTKITLGQDRPLRDRPARTSQRLDLLIRNVTLVDVVNKKVLTNKTIGVTGDRITSIEDHPTTQTGKTVIDGSNYIALPGFINTHTHLWQHICKACAPKEKLQQWVRIYNPIHYLTAEELYEVVLAASSEAALSGITTVSDYASLGFNDYAFEANARAIQAAGLGGVLVWSNTAIFLPDRIKLDELRRLRETNKNQFDIWMGFGGLSFYSLPQVYSGIVIARKLGMRTTEHTMENIEEQRSLYEALSKYHSTYKDRLNAADRMMIEQALALGQPAAVDSFDIISREAQQALAVDKAQNKLTPEQKELLSKLTRQRVISPLPILDHLKALPNYLAIHSVWQQPEDIEIMRRNNVSVSHNPESNMYLSSGIAPISDYLDAGITVSLGTDGAASNDGINFFSAMREMWNLYKIDYMNTEVTRNFDEWNILQAATINGAKALLLDSTTGSLDVGKEADIILISKDELGMSPLRPDRLLPLLIYSGNNQNVDYVISDGKLIVRDGKLARFNESILAGALSRIANVVDERIRNGKIWNDEYRIASAGPYWYKYRSVRTADTIDVKLSNETTQPMRVSVISSAMRFSGGSCYVVDKEVSSRFPEECATAAFKEEIILKRGESVRVTKRKGGFDYVISTTHQTIPRKSAVGQLLLLAEKVE